jgi:predicted GIY-YIG superfamily endonuclease
MICAGEERHALYRFYDAHEELLYVGITDDPWRRWREHVLTQPWYPQVKHQAVSWYDTEAEATGAEKRAIRSERPRFNVAGAVRAPEARLSLNFVTVIEVCYAWICIPAFLSVATIVAAVYVPVHSGGAPYVHILGWAAVVTALTVPAPLLAVLLLSFASPIYRFACWLERNFGDQACDHARIAMEQKERERIPPSEWIYAPRQTFRIWRRMHAGGPRDFWVAVAEEDANR